jgi:hypothetical protein
MRIDGQQLQYWIDHFYGYGSWRARFWFVSYEESGGEVPEEVADKIGYFHKLDADPDGTLCDIRDLYRHVGLALDGPKASLFSNRYQYRFDKDAIQHGVWKNLIAFVHGYKSEKLPDVMEYQKTVLATAALHNEALIPLYPLPSPHNHAWYYSWLDVPQLSFLKNRSLYQEQVYPTRIERILSNIRAYQPEVVLMYGMENINKLKQSAQDFFDGAQFKMVKATTRQIPQHHRADLGGTTMLITTQIPALRHNRIETGFDWEQFGQKVKSGKV